MCSWLTNQIDDWSSVSHSQTPIRWNLRRRCTDDRAAARKKPPLLPTPPPLTLAPPIQSRRGTDHKTLHFQRFIQCMVTTWKKESWWPLGLNVGPLLAFRFPLLHRSLSSLLFLFPSPSLPPSLLFLPRPTSPSHRQESKGEVKKKRKSRDHT